MPTLRTSPSGNATTRWTSEAPKQALRPIVEIGRSLGYTSHFAGTHAMKYSIFSLAKAALSGHKGWTRNGAIRAEGRIRRGDHRRRRPWAGDRLLSSPRSTASQCRGAREGLDRLRQCRPQHHHHPLQLLLPGNTGFYEHSMKLWEGWSRTSTTTPWSASAACINLYHSDAQRDAYARRGNMMRLNGVDAELLDREQRAQTLPFLNFDTRASRSRAACCSARRHRAPRCRRLGLCARRRPIAASTSSRIAKSPASTSSTVNGKVTGVETSRGAISAEEGRHGRRRQPSRVAAMAGMRLPIESHVLQAFVSEGSSRSSRGHHLRRRPFLHQPVRQGRARLRRRHRRLQFLRPARQLPVVEDVCEGGMALMPGSAACACCATGAASWTCRWTARRSSTAPRSTGSISMPAGAMAASRRRRLGLRLRPSAGEGRAASRRRALPLDRFRQRPRDRRKGPGAQPNLH
jgi:hypothetical protein